MTALMKSGSFIIFFATFLQNVTIAKRQDSTSFFIDKLNWTSFGITTNYTPTPYLGHDANRIIKINDKEKLRKLIKALKCEYKTVAINMILTQLLEPEKYTFKQEYVYGRDSTIIEIDYSFNKLSWTWKRAAGPSISAENITYITKYWTDIIKDK